MKRRLFLLFVLVSVAVMLLSWAEFRGAVAGFWGRTITRNTVADRLRQYGDVARARQKPHFLRAQVAYPPKQLLLLGLKDERRLLVYAAGADGAFRFVRTYQVRAASGHLGPKLREGDQQVPEGLYRVEALNPNSRFHLSLRLDYPNAFDRQTAKRDGRTNLGGDIMIHG